MAPADRAGRPTASFASLRGPRKYLSRTQDRENANRDFRHTQVDRADVLPTNRVCNTPPSRVEASLVRGIGTVFSTNLGYAQERDRACSDQRGPASSPEVLYFRRDQHPIQLDTKKRSLLPKN